MNHKTVVPQLRFQEFDGEWQLKNLEEITSWASGGTPPKDNPLFWDGDIPWISASSMRGIVYSNSELKITNAGLKKGSKLAKKGSLLILVRGSMLFNKIPIGVVSKDVSFNQDVKSIVIDNSYSTSEFILNWFTAFEPKILNMVTGTGIGAGKLDLPDLKALKISLPALPEQQKIASFLSAVDEKIQQLSRKKELLEQYKKGLMQQLFSGKLRFKDENGIDYADWIDFKIGDLDFYISDGNYGELYPKAGEMKSSGTPFIRANNIKNLKLTWKDMKYIEPEHHKILESGHLKTGDILVTTRGDIGMLAYVEEDFDNANINAQICLIRSPDNLISKYILQFLASDFGLKQFKSLQTGTALKQLPKGNLNKIIIPIPSIKEQQKIAAFLSNIDTKIESTNQQINQMQSFKKGLLQQMFV